MTERIDHAAEAVKHIEWAHDQQGTDGEFEFTVRDNALIAQAEATLALVEQQRIANIIALAEVAQDQYGNYSGEAGLIGQLFDNPTTELGNMQIKPVIKEGLGL